MGGLFKNRIPDPAVNRISKRMEKAVSDGVFPGAVLLCSFDHDIVFHEAFGLSDIFEKTPVTKESLFDLASLTKPLATAMAISCLVGQQKLCLDQKLGDVLPEFASSDKASITVEMLLRHTSGLPAWREYFRQINPAGENPRDHLRRLLVRERLENSMNKEQVYSDLGYMILSWVIESISGRRLDRFVREEVYHPLGIEDLFFPGTGQDKKRTGSRSRRMVATQICPWRKKLIKGEVDDDNAWAVGGIEGHAGLFGDARSVHRLCGEILTALTKGPATVLDPDVLACLVEKKGSFDYVAGFDTPSKTDSSAGRYFSTSSIGHLGFTGTSFWIDPEAGIIIILLTNRVHPSRENIAIKKFRPEIHDLIRSELL